MLIIYLLNILFLSNSAGYNDIVQVNAKLDKSFLTIELKTKFHYSDNELKFSYELIDNELIVDLKGIKKKRNVKPKEAKAIIKLNDFNKNFLALKVKINNRIDAYNIVYSNNKLHVNKFYSRF